jgi:iron-sulfur cluster assembly protein
MASPETTPFEATPEGAAPAIAESQSYPVTLTAKAVQMVKLSRQEEGLDEAHGLRVAVVGGGCSGFQYALDFTNEARESDHVYAIGGLTVYVDPISARYLAGTQIDYVMGTAGAGFKFNNPKAVGSCGCGSSFAV